MNELFNLIRHHYEKNEAGTSLVSKVTTILDSLPEGSVDSSQLAGLDQFHVMGLAATEQLGQTSANGAVIMSSKTVNSIEQTSMAELLGRSFGPVWAKVGAWLVIWTAFGSSFEYMDFQVASQLGAGLYWCAL